MEIDDHIEKSEEGLEQIIAAAEMFEENHYLEAIKQKKLDEYKILRLTEDVKLWHSRMRKEALKLAMFSEHWIEDYATANNRRFQDAYNLFSKVRSSICSSRKIFRKFCRRTNKIPTNINASKHVTDRSILSAHVVGRDIFGLKSYNENVEILYETIKEFFSTLVLTLALCHRMIRDEAIVKNDGDRCLEIYKKCREAVLSSAKLLAKTFGIQIKQISKNELVERRKNAKSIKEFAQKNYHCLNKEEYLTLVAYEVISESSRNGMSKTETVLWGDNIDMVKKVRKAIINIEKLVQGKKKISGLLMLEFIKWCHVKKKHEHKLYDYFCETYQGSVLPVGWTQIFNTQKNLNISDEELANAFQKDLDSIEQIAA